MASEQKLPAVSGHACRVYHGAFSGDVFIAREMMLGTRDQFEYWECGQRGCVQILEVPENLDEYYPRDHFSFKPHHVLGRNLLRRAFDRRRVRQALGADDWVGKVVNRLLKPLDYVDWCRFAQIGTDTRVLDVGCGAGKLPLRMKFGGFKSCAGIDPHIDADMSMPPACTSIRSKSQSLPRNAPVSSISSCFIIPWSKLPIPMPR